MCQPDPTMKNQNENLKMAKPDMLFKTAASQIWGKLFGMDSFSLISRWTIPLKFILKGRREGVNSVKHLQTLPN
jgi:hypothetical protein